MQTPLPLSSLTNLGNLDPNKLSKDGARRDVSESGLIIEFEEVGPEICYILLAGGLCRIINGRSCWREVCRIMMVKVIGDG